MGTKTARDTHPSNQASSRTRSQSPPDSPVVDFDDPPADRSDDAAPSGMGAIGATAARARIVTERIARRSSRSALNGAGACRPTSSCTGASIREGCRLPNPLS
jgi:hypothetical protein